MNGRRLAANEIDPVRERVFTELDRLTARIRGPIGIAVSGGSDSTALTLLARQWAGARHLRAITVDHQLRPEAAEEAGAVGRFCNRLGLPHDVCKWSEGPEAKSSSGNLSANSRKARHRLIAAWAQSHGVSAILLGHTQDDQAETVLMRLMRGSTVDGLSGMRDRTEFGGLTWLRPLLATKRQDLRDLLCREGLNWVDDPTNDDATYERVRVRKAIKALDIDSERLALTAWHLTRQHQVLEADRDRLAAQAVEIGAAGEIMIDLESFRSAQEDSRLAVLADAITWIGGADYRPRFSSLSGLLKHADGRTLGGCLLLERRGRLTICREFAAVEPSQLIEHSETVWDRRWIVNAPVDADRYVSALGTTGLTRLRVLRGKHADPPLGWRAAPRAAQISAPAIWHGGELISIPMAGFCELERTVESGPVIRLASPPARFGRCRRL